MYYFYCLLKMSIVINIKKTKIFSFYYEKKVKTYSWNDQNK